MVAPATGVKFSMLTQMPRDCTVCHVWYHAMNSPGPLAGIPYTRTMSQSRSARARAPESYLTKSEKKMVAAGNFEGAAASKRAREGKKKKKGARWHFGFKDASLGPLSVSNFSMGSGDRPASRSVQGPVGGVRVNENLGRNEARTLHVRREQVGVVNGSVGYSIIEYPINPGNATLFPWLSQLAPLYEQYRIHEMQVEFVPTGSGYAAPNVSGRVVLATDYDVMSPALGSLQEAESKDPNVPFGPFEAAILRLDAHRLTPAAKFNRGAQYPAGGDPKTYDAGKLSVVVQGTPNTSQIGIIYVSYSVELITPQLPQVADVPPNYHLAQYTADNIASIANTTWTQLTFTRNPLPAGGQLVLTYNAGTFSLQPGMWRFYLNVSCNNTTSQLTRLSVKAILSGGDMYMYDEGHSGGGVGGFSSMSACVPLVITASLVNQPLTFWVQIRHAGGVTSTPAAFGPMTLSVEY